MDHIVYIYKGRKPVPINTVSGDFKKIAENKWIRIRSKETEKRMQEREKAKDQETKQDLEKKYKDKPEFIALMNLPGSAWKKETVEVLAEDGINTKKKEKLILSDSKFAGDFYDKNVGLFYSKAKKIAQNIGLQYDEKIDLQLEAGELLINAINAYGKNHDPENPKDIMHHLNNWMLPLQYAATKLKNKEFSLPQNLSRYINKYQKLHKEHGGDIDKIYDEIDLKVKDIHPDLSDKEIGNEKLPIDDFDVKEKSETQNKKIESKLKTAENVREKLIKEINIGYENKDEIVGKLQEKKKNIESKLEEEKQKVIEPLKIEIEKKKKIFKKEIPEIIKKQIALMQQTIDNPDNAEIRKIKYTLSDIDKQIDKATWTKEKYDDAINFIEKKFQDTKNKIELSSFKKKKRMGARNVFQQLDEYLGRKKVNIGDMNLLNKIKEKPRFGDMSEENINLLNKHIHGLNSSLDKILTPKQAEIMKLFFGTSDKIKKIQIRDVGKLNMGKDVNQLDKMIDMLPPDFYERKSDIGTSYWLERVKSKQNFKNPDYENQKKEYDKKKADKKREGVNMSEWAKNNPIPEKTYSKDSPEGKKLFEKEYNDVYDKTVKEGKHKKDTLSVHRKKQLLSSDFNAAKAKIFQNLVMFKDNKIFQGFEDKLIKKI